MRKRYQNILVKVVLLSFYGLLLSGCMAIHQPLDPIYKQSINNMVIVSTLGDNLEMVKIGTTIFNNDQLEDDFSVFEMDRKIEETTTQYLKDYSGFHAVSRPDLRNEFQDAFGHNFKLKESLKELNLTLKDLNIEGIDAIMIISQLLMPFEDTPVDVKGYGIAVRTFLMIWYAKAYIGLNLTLIDVATQKIVFDRFLWRWKDIKFSKWQRSFSELRTEEQKDISDFFDKVINEDLPVFLRKFNF